MAQEEKIRGPSTDWDGGRRDCQDWTGTDWITGPGSRDATNQTPPDRGWPVSTRGQTGYCCSSCNRALLQVMMEGRQRKFRSQRGCRDCAREWLLSGCCGGECNKL